MADVDPWEGFDSAPAPSDPWTEFDPPEADAQVHWAGRPTTMAAIERAASKNKVSPSTILELGTTAGRIESRLASTAAGQLVLRAGEGIKQVGESLAASFSRAAGREDIAARIHQDRRNREEFLQFVEKGGDVESVLGERGSRIFNQTTQSIGSVGTAAVLAGPVGVYSHVIGDSWERGLDDAQQSGLDGVDAVGHAGRSAAIEGGLTFLMGRIPGITTLEESLSPAARNAVRKSLSSKGVQSSLKKAAAELGGWTAEGAEEMLIAGGQQINEIAAGMRDGFDWDEILEAGASGVAGRGAVGAVKSLNSQLQKIETSLPEVAAGARAAEIDLERGINPREMLDYLDDPKEFERQSGRSGTSKQQRDSYRDALNFYIDEARASGNTAALVRMEQDVRKLREEERQRAERIKQGKAKNKGKAGESLVSREPVVEQPLFTADERATFSLADFESRVLSPLVGTTVEPAPANVNPYILAPWESETRPQRRIRLLSRDVAQHKETIKELRKSAVENKRLREDQLTEARKLVQENIPRDEQWKFFRGIQAAETPAAVNNLLDRVSGAIDARDHRLAVMDLKQAFRKVSNLRKEFADVVKGVRGGIDLHAIKNKEAAVELQKWAIENPQAILTEKDQATIDRLDKTPIADMAADDIRDLSEYVQRLAYESKVKDRIIGNQQSALIRDVGDAIAREAASSPKLATTEEGERAVSSFLLLEAAERPEATMRRISPTLTDHIYNKMAVEDQNVYDLAAKQVTESLAGVFDSLGLKDTLVEWRDKKRLVDGVELSRGEALMIQRWMQDPHAAKSVTQAGIVLDNGKRVVPPMTPKMLAELADFVGDEGNAISQFMFGYDNGTLIDAVNATNEKLTGRELTGKRDVVPIVRSDQDFAHFLTAGRSAGFQEALLDSYRSFKHRTDAVAPLAIPKGLDAIDMFMTHADRMNRFAAFGVNARNAEMLFNDPGVRQTILARNGQAGYDHIKNAVRAHVIGYKPRTLSDRAVAKFNAAVAAGKIALSPSVMLQQTLDPLTAAPWDENGMADLSAAYSELTARGIQAVEDEMERVLGTHSGNFWRRYKSGDFLGEHTSGQFKTQSHFRPSSLAQKVMYPLTRAEYFASAMPNYLAAKAAARRRFGFPENDYSIHDDNPEWVKSVVTAWDKRTYRGSNSSHGLELSGILRYAKDNPASAIVLNFYNTASKIYSLWTMGVNASRQGRVKEASAFLSAALVNGAMVAVIQQALTLSSADEEEPFWRKALNRFAGNTVGLYPLVGELLQQNVVAPVSRAALGLENQGFRMDNPVLVYETVGDMLWHATRAVTEFTNVLNDAYDPEKAHREFIDAGSRFLELRGIPAGQVHDLFRRAWRGAEAAGLLPADKFDRQ